MRRDDSPLTVAGEGSGARVGRATVWQGDFKQALAVYGEIEGIVCHREAALRVHPFIAGKTNACAGGKAHAEAIVSASRRAGRTGGLIHQRFKSHAIAFEADGVGVCQIVGDGAQPAIKGFEAGPGDVHGAWHGGCSY